MMLIWKQLPLGWHARLNITPRFGAMPGTRPIIGALPIIVTLRVLNGELSMGTAGNTQIFGTSPPPDFPGGEFTENMYAEHQGVRSVSRTFPSDPKAMAAAEQWLSTLTAFEIAEVVL